MFTVCCWIVSRVQDRKRNEVAKSIQQVCVRECHSLILLRRRIQRDLFSYLVEGQLIGKSKISSSVSETWSTSSHQTSELCLDKEGKGRTIRLLWEKEETTALVISPPVHLRIYQNSNSFCIYYNTVKYFSIYRRRWNCMIGQHF